MNPSSPTASGPRQLDWLYLAALLAHLPLGAQYCLRMWRQGHYQFFPLLMAVAFWLIADRLSGLPTQDSRSTGTYVALLLNALLLTLGTLLLSPLIWILSFLMLIAIFIHDRYGIRGVRAAWPAWLLLWFVVPLPKGLDLTIINQMQFLASQLASWILDAFGQTHFREGVVLITEKKQFFTEEACSGVRSLFSSCAAIAIYGVINRYGWIRHLFNLAQTVVWVICGNALRVAIVVYVADNYYEPIASGPTHEMLGLVVFLFIFGLALSTDRAVNAWVESRRNLDPLVAYDPVLEAEAQDSPTAALPPAQPASRPTTDAPAWKWGLIAFFFVLFVFAGRLAYAEIGGDLRSYDELVEVAESDLPNQIAGWTQRSFAHQVRDGGGLLAPESFIWTFVKDGQEITISLDSPYYDFHNLKSCYMGLGWDLDYSHHYNRDQLTAADQNYTWIDMNNNGKQGIVIFSAFDRYGDLVLPTSMIDWKGRILENIQFAATSSKTLPISQIQLLLASENEIENQEELKALFFRVRQILLQNPRFGR